MQYAKKAAGRFECNDGVIGFGHRMSVGRIDMVVCVNCGNRNVVRDVMMMAGTDDTDGFPIEISNRRRRWSLLKLHTGADKHR